MWTIGISIGSRMLGVAGTLLITHFLAPEVVGELGVALVLVLSMNQISNFGFGPYVVTTRRGSEAIFHASFYSIAFAAVGFLVILFVAPLLAPFFDAPDMAQYVPGIVAATFIQRIGFTASRVLVRQMRFKLIALGLGLGELAYTVVSVALAATGWGGDAIVIGNVARGVTMTALYCGATDINDWLAPCKLTMERTREIFRFGVPLWIGSIAHFASRRWDNLLFSRIFGPHTLGLYNLAYNLADIPTTQVGEHIGDVLLPSYTRMEEAGRRKWALMRSTSLMALLVFPLAIGLGAIAPTLVSLLFNREWQGVAPLLVVLSVLSVLRPVCWVVGSYLTALQHTRALMLIEVIKVVTLLVAVAGLGLIGPLWACAGVGIAFGVGSYVSLWAVRHYDDIPMWRITRGMLGPLAACVPMAGAVLASRYVMIGLDLEASVWSLGAELVAGAVVYVGAAFLLAPSTARDFLKLVLNALHRGGGDDSDGDQG